MPLPLIKKMSSTKDHSLLENDHSAISEEMQLEIGTRSHCSNGPRSLKKAVLLLLGVIHLLLPTTFCCYDTLCQVYEKSSILNCSLPFIMNDPLPIILASFINSDVFSIAVLITLNLKSAPLKASTRFPVMIKAMFRKSSFWSFFALFMVVAFDYVTRMTNANGNIMTCLISVSILGLRALTLLIVFSVNYVFPPRLESVTGNIFSFAFYWIILVSYFMENLYLTVADMFDVAEKIFPMDSKKDLLLTKFYVLILTIKVTFQLRLLRFFWVKMFNGNKDLFSGNSVLVQLPGPSATNPDREEIALEDTEVQLHASKETLG